MPIRPIEEIDVFKVPSKDLENVIDRGIRHKSGATPTDFLNSFLRISRPLAYATQDDSWGEFEKHFTIIVRRMVRAERKLEELGHVDSDDLED
jgi:hypothetical protein